MWREQYKAIDYKGGDAKFICNDDEDMIEIRYDDGMFIDVGYIEEQKKYYITVCEKEDMESWNNPLSVTPISDKNQLCNEIQKVINRYRI